MAVQALKYYGQWFYPLSLWEGGCFFVPKIGGLTKVIKCANMLSKVAKWPIELKRNGMKESGNYTKKDIATSPLPTFSR